MTNPISDIDSPFYNVQEEHQQRIKELFANGDLLTYSLSGNYYANKKMFHLVKENKFLKSTIAKYSLLEDHQIALFSDGTLILLGEKETKIQKKFIEIVQQDGFLINNIEFAKIGLMLDIRRYAQNIYKDKFAEVELSDEKSFVERLFKNNNICISAETNIIPFEARKFLAVFSDGRFIVSNRYIRNKYNYDLDKRVQKAVKKASNQFLIWDIEYVPESYITAIYERAEKSGNFLPPAEKQKPNDLEQMNKFIDNLFANNNKCLTVVNLDNVITVERDVYALFENDRLIVNEDEKYSAAAIEFMRIVLKDYSKTLVPEYVPAYYLPAIYERALKNQKSAKDIFIEKLKKKAKKMVRTSELAHHEALEKIAIETGFKNWKQICDIDEDQARIYLGIENRKEYYLKAFGRLPSDLL